MTDRIPIIGDRVECKLHVGSGQFQWFKGSVYGVRDTNFDVKFDEPSGPMKIGGGLFHFHHDNWRFDTDSEPSAMAPEPISVVTDPKTIHPDAGDHFTLLDTEF